MIHLEITTTEADLLSVSLTNARKGMVRDNLTKKHALEYECICSLIDKLRAALGKVSPITVPGTG